MKNTEIWEFEHKGEFKFKQVGVTWNGKYTKVESE